MKKYEAIFFDMDGTLINVKSGAKWPRDFNDWELIPGVKNKILEFVSVINPKALLIVSNQGGLGRKQERWRQFRDLKMKKVMDAAFPTNVERDLAFAPQKDKMRKPDIGMAEMFRDKYKLNLSNCLMVGDASDAVLNFSDSDRKFAENAGMDYLDIKEFLNYKL